MKFEFINIKAHEHSKYPEYYALVSGLPDDQWLLSLVGALGKSGLDATGKVFVIEHTTKKGNYFLHAVELNERKTQ